MNHILAIFTILAFTTISRTVVSGFVPGHAKRPIPAPFSTKRRYAPENANDDIIGDSNLQPSTADSLESPPLESFTSPVLKKHASTFLEWKKKYGHPNIPLKNEGGNACQVLRRLHVQQQLTETEVSWLESIGFRFHSIEDVYRFADFDEMVSRLLSYEEAHPNNNFQVPKKCKEDPELGAWVTGIRRLGKDGVNPEHERRLDAIGFAWKSTRKCGSKFMLKFREYTQAVEESGLQSLLEDPNVISWVKAQQQALKKGTLSQTRVQYMGQLFGERWTTIGKETKT